MNLLVLQTESPYIHLTFFQQVLQLILVSVGGITNLMHLNVMFALLKIEDAFVSNITCCDDIIDNTIVVDDRVDTELDIFVNSCLR